MVLVTNITNESVFRFVILLHFFFFEVSSLLMFSLACTLDFSPSIDHIMYNLNYNIGDRIGETPERKVVPETELIG